MLELVTVSLLNGVVYGLLLFMPEDLRNNDGVRKEWLEV